MKIKLSIGEVRVSIRYGRTGTRRTTTVQISRYDEPRNAFDAWLGQAFCNKRDRFIKPIGREVALRKLLKGNKDIPKADRITLWAQLAPHVFDPTRRDRWKSKSTSRAVESASE